jgi:hypothetical protein
MNENFWEHMLNAASHMLDAKRMSDAERQAQREQAAQRQKQQRKTERPAASFSSAPSEGPGCCIAKRRFKVK